MIVGVDRKEDNYVEINRRAWNNKTDVHFNSDFYDTESFIRGKSSLNDIELALLGNVKGKTILHLQCHFGQDSISLARMGAKVTGVDLSNKAIERAKELTINTGEDCTFICCDIYNLPHHLSEQFDIVFTSYGTIGWLPDMNKWASVVSKYLKTGGQFIIAEFHPVVWMFNGNFDGIGYNYFNVEPIIETEEGTYTDTDAALTQEVITWNHPISEVVNNLIQHGLTINSLNEYNYSPYDCFKGTVEFELNKFRIKHLKDKIPMVYSIVATK